MISSVELVLFFQEWTYARSHCPTCPSYHRMARSEIEALPHLTGVAAVDEPSSLVIVVNH